MNRSHVLLSLLMFALASSLAAMDSGPRNGQRVADEAVELGLLQFPYEADLLVPANRIAGCARFGGPINVRDCQYFFLTERELLPITPMVVIPASLGVTERQTCASKVRPYRLGEIALPAALRLAPTASRLPLGAAAWGFSPAVQAARRSVPLPNLAGKAIHGLRQVALAWTENRPQRTVSPRVLMTVLSRPAVNLGQGLLRTSGLVPVATQAASRRIAEQQARWLAAYRCRAWARADLAAERARARADRLAYAELQARRQAALARVSSRAARQAASRALALIGRTLVDASEMLATSQPKPRREAATTSRRPTSHINSYIEL